MRHLSVPHWIALVLALAVLAAFGVLFAVSWIESRQARDLETRLSASATLAARTAVVYFSRSGNTALAARHVAQRLDARLFRLDAPAYELGMGGLGHALWDANALKARPDRLPDIQPRIIDLTPFDTVYLGSPIWLYSPAPPLWAFVEQNRFDGQRVVLFNTFNSHFGEDHIAAFKAKVMARGARSFEHRHIKRGRMTQQLTPDEMTQAIDEQWFDPPAAP
ncbi:flavodoxin family protein [Achromobacter xylosoxidans]|uniref:flavodoxin family protein n=1 Tax=Alcaligenes xylosoxydans xylosoxydans TaxID=85698 RepID=UPI000AA8014A|nr:hypothetical protein [Achromobacter xylosoxidans]